MVQPPLQRTRKIKHRKKVPGINQTALPPKPRTPANLQQEHPEAELQLHEQHGKYNKITQQQDPESNKQPTRRQMQLP